ncbi:hypothetical protein PoB_003946000 [Plakobranchus ocellatus]|uniref:Uncharacterized protein n=1 Tax=Plakobranchus ocellatus TaxID=259542 RepID=A0AAV4AX63_9GAST|nr:hypothetical protein PoB_003946000 [Plakobranchus ocellatus]
MKAASLSPRLVTNWPVHPISRCTDARSDSDLSLKLVSTQASNLDVQRILRVMQPLADQVPLLAVLILTYLSATLPNPTSSPAPSNLDCFQERQAQKHQLKCFTDQDIHVNFPEYKAGGAGASTEEQKENYVNAMIAQNPERLCSRQKNFKAALKCAMNHTVSCMPVDYRGYMPQPSMMEALVDTLCENTSKINFRCVEEKAESLFTCGFRKGQEAFQKGNQFVSLEDFLCKAFQFNAQCQRTVLRSCGCPTVRLYESLSRDHLYPPNCSRPMLEGPPTKCDAKNEALFAESGFTTVRAQWSCSIMLSLISMVLSSLLVFPSRTVQYIRPPL